MMINEDVTGESEWESGDNQRETKRFCHLCL